MASLIISLVQFTANWVSNGPKQLMYVIANNKKILINSDTMMSGEWHGIAVSSW